MAKKKLIELAEEYDKTFEELYELVTLNFDEEMLTGRGRGTWVNDDGQSLLDDMIEMPVLYRGKVLRECPNKLYLMVHHRDRACKIPVKIPKRMIGKLLNKIIYFEENRDNGKITYHWVKRDLQDVLK